MKAPSFKALVVIVLALCVAPVSLAQVDKDSNDRRFHDDLLNHLVGKWNVSAVLIGVASTDLTATRSLALNDPVTARTCRSLARHRCPAHLAAVCSSFGDSGQLVWRQVSS